MSKNQTSGTASATHCGYWAWKIFQAGLLCAGDFSDLEEMLADGCGELDAGEISSVAVEACQLAKHTADVGKFTHKFATQLTTHKSGAAPAKRMEQAHNLYESFVAADTNRDGRISRTEYIRFAAKLGETREDSSAIFTLLDKDRDGQLSFQEWVEGCKEAEGSASNCLGYAMISFAVVLCLCAYWLFV